MVAMPDGRSDGIVLMTLEDFSMLIEAISSAETKGDS
jgi:hypothetical protein